MPNLKKRLKRIPRHDRRQLQAIIFLIMKNDFVLLDIKKVAGHDDVYRVRSGRYRILFRKEQPVNYILDIRLRNENTYKNIPL